MANSNQQVFNQRRKRISVKSAIPSLQLNLKSLPQRPSPTISSRQSQNLQTNHFKCSLNFDLTLYQYDLSVEEFGQKSENWYEIDGRSRCSTILKSLISNNLIENQYLVWHDEKRCLYSLEQIPTPKIIHHPNERQRIQIKSLANQWSTKEIQDYISGRATNYPFDVIRILETLLKRSLADRVEIVGKTIFPVNQVGETDDGGFIQRVGFFQSLNLSQDKITLNLQTKRSTFYPEMLLSDLIFLQLGHQDKPNDFQIRRLNSILKDCQLATKQSQWKQIYEFSRFDRRSAKEIKLEDGTNLVEYYRQKGIELNYGNYPCIQAYRLGDDDSVCHLPVELCLIKSWQIYDKQIPTSLNQARIDIPRPHIRYQAILGSLRFCDYKNKNNRLCRAIGFQIDEEMTPVRAQILQQPEIQNGQNHFAEVRIGRIQLNGYLFDPRPLNKIAITYFGENYRNVVEYVRSFTRDLLGALKRYHIDVLYDFKQCRSSLEDIDNHFRQLKDDGYEFAVCIMNSSNDEQLTQMHNNIKTAGTIHYGIVTQCVHWPKVSRMRNRSSYCDNLIKKINYKNNGINTQVNLSASLEKRISSSDYLMFFGADVIHPTNVTRNHPSISAVVGSGDSLSSFTAARVCRQFPREGKCSIETILGLREMVADLLDYYRYSNNDNLPNKIVFYRDGVDDGQFGQLLAHEIPLIRQAFSDIYQDPSNYPKLTFIVVKKRHNTRFFNVSQNKIENMSIGAVIDTTITHRYQFDFYLNSHNAFQGVNRPSLYHVILDENNFTASEIALLTYHQCFTDPRSSASEAIPSVLHQADIAAMKARDLFYNDESSSTAGDNRRSQALTNPTLNDLDYEMLQIHDEIRDFPVLS